MTSIRPVCRPMAVDDLLFYLQVFLGGDVPAVSKLCKPRELIYYGAVVVFRS